MTTFDPADLDAALDEADQPGYASLTHELPAHELPTQAPAAQTSGSAATGDASRGPAGPSTATRLTRLGLSRYELGVMSDGTPFALPRNGGPRHIARQLVGGRLSLRAELSKLYFDRNKAVPSASALKDAVTVLEGFAQERPATEAWLRVAPDATGGCWLDLGTPAGDVVHVTRHGWRVTDQCPALFRRTDLTAALPTPTAGAGIAALERLWRLLNVAERYRPLILAWLVHSLLPESPHTIVNLTGEQGTGKSTASRIIAGIVDPSPAQVRKAPKDEDAWVTAAAGSWVVALDNLSGVPPWLSDALCRASTGDADVRRRLYTDAGLHVLAFRRAVLLNGIDLGSLRGDLLDRLLVVELDVIAGTRRRTDSELHAAWTAAHPVVLGALLDLAVLVLQRLPAVELDELPRMADFARVLRAVDDVLGTAGYALYLDSRESLSEDAMQSHPVLAAVRRHIRAPWSGPAGDLLALLLRGEDEAQPPKGWPQSPRGLAGVVKRNAPTMRRVGWDVTTRHDPHSKQMIYDLTPPASGARAANRDHDALLLPPSATNDRPPGRRLVSCHGCGVPAEHAGPGGLGPGGRCAECETGE